MFMDGNGLGLVYIFDGCFDIWYDEYGDYLLLYVLNGEKKIYYKGGGKINFVGVIMGMFLGMVIFFEFNLLYKDFINECFRWIFVVEWCYYLGE